MSGNYTISDLASIARAFFLFGLFAFVPGYVLGWLLDLLQFRNRTPAARIAMSVPLSIAFCPILSYLLGHWLPAPLVWFVYGLLWLAFAALLRPVSRDSFAGFSRLLNKTSWVFFALIAGWTMLGAILLVDIQIGDRIYFHLSTFDYCIRTAFTNAISTTGIPPQNPLFLASHPAHLRYHYFWLILCSLVDRLGGSAVGPRHAVIAGTLWSGIGLAAIVVLYLRFFDSLGALNLRRRSLIGIGLLGVTGLDIIPCALYLLVYRPGVKDDFPMSVEWWNEQIDGWVLSTFWQPHNIAALTACLLGFLLISHAAQGRKLNLAAGIAAGVAFATAVGTAIYTAFVFAVFLGIWTVITIVRKWHRETALLVIAGITASLLSLSYLRELSGPAGGGSFLELTIRSFYPVEAYLKGLNLNQRWIVLIADGLLLPLNYFVELGFFFVIAHLQWKRFRQRRENLTRSELAGICMVATSVGICTFFRSSVAGSTINDLGGRGFLIAQFMLLIWGANYLADKGTQLLTRDQRVLLTIFVCLGAAGTAYDLVVQRVYLMLADAGKISNVTWLPADREVGKRAYANRLAYEWLQSRTSSLAVVQQNPYTLQDTLYLLYGNRRTVAEDLGCGAGFGGDPQACEPIVTSVNEVFAAGADQRTADTVCQRLGIDVLIAKDTDKAWADSHSWVWTRKPAFANNYVRIFPCSALSGTLISRGENATVSRVR